MSRNPQLRLPDLVFGLERYGNRYSSIDVLADDVYEIRSVEPVPGLMVLDEGSRRFWYCYEEKVYVVQVFQEAGVVRLSRSGAAPPPPSPQAGALAAGILGGLAGLALGAATSKRGEGATAGLIVGLLAGAAIGGIAQPQAGAPTRVLTMRFDQSLGQWRAYDGALVPWMKENLAPS